VDKGKEGRERKGGSEGMEVKKGEREEKRVGEEREGGERKGEGKKGSGKGILAIPILVCFRRR